jgi:hypothetical protein
MTDVITNEIEYFIKITKLIEDDKRKHSLLTKTMKEILEAIANSRDQLQHIEAWFWDLVGSDQKRQLLVECAIDGFQKAGIFMLLAEGRFTLDQLVDKAPNAKTSGGQGVYARIYLAKKRMSFHEQDKATYDLRKLRQLLSEQGILRTALAEKCKSTAEQRDLRILLANLRKSIAGQRKSIAEQRNLLAEQSKSSLYIGSSRAIMSRMASHDHFLPKKFFGIHPVAHSEATKKYYRVLCNLDDNDYAKQDDRVRLVVEQLLIILLGTYVLDLRTARKVDAFVEKTWAKKAIAEETTETEDVEKDHSDTVDETETIGEMFERFRDRSTKTSITLAKLGYRVCAKCGWRPITSRSSSNGQFGTDILSLNQFSPIDTVEKRSRKTKKAKNNELPTNEEGL